MKRTKFDGINAMRRENYKLSQEAESDLQRVDRTWWQSTPVIIFLVVSLSLLDAATLFNVLDTVMVENALIGKLMTGGLALTLNFLPLIGGYLLRERYYDRSRVSNFSLAALLATFLLLWGATVYLRFETKELNFSGMESTMVNTVGTQTAGPDGETSDGVANALTFLLAVMPLVTSIVNLYLGFISDDPVKKRINKLRMRCLELEAMEAELMAAENEMCQDRIGKLLLLNEDRYRAAVRKTRSRFEGIAAFTRFWLAQYLEDPASISKLSQDALKCVTPVERQMEPDDGPLDKPCQNFQEELIPAKSGIEGSDNLPETEPPVAEAS